MNTKKDEPEKKETAGAAGPASSRPHATLDLKATVVDPKGTKEPSKEPTKDEKKPAASGPASGAGPRAPAGGATAAATDAARPKPGATAEVKRPTSTEEADSAAPATARPGGRGGFFTHLAAGIVGGIVALLAADMLASQLGLTGSTDQADVSATLLRRIEALESGGKSDSAAAELATRLKSTEAKLGRLDQLGASVDRLTQGQGELAGKVKALDAKLGAEAGDAGAEARVKKLEDQLAALTAAGERDPNGGGLPQLAAITGKIADLESTVTNQLDALRKSVNEEIDTRLAAATEASEAAKSGTQRIDRELASIKADSAQLASRLNAVGAESERAIQTLRSTQDEITRLKVDLNAQLPTFAKPEDVAAATSPLSTRLDTLQQDMQGVVKGEEERKATAGRIVLSLELANLKRAIDRGRGFAPELAQARKFADGNIDLAPLARFADTGVPTLPELRQDFKAVAFKVIDADQQPAEGSIVERLLAGAKSVVRVRKISHESDDKTAEAVVARMESALAADRLDDVIEEAKSLPPAAQDAARDFLAKVEARNAVDRALANVETQLKASLVAPPGAAGTGKE